MAKSKKKTAPKKAPRKKLTSERPLKNRPADPADDIPPNVDPDTETGEETGDGETPEEEELETPATPKPARRGRQARLPGTEDPAIDELEGLAEEYAEARDRRMAIDEEEADLKQQLLAEMKKHHKVAYHHGGIDIEIIVVDEKVRVRIKKDE